MDLFTTEYFNLLHLILWGLALFAAGIDFGTASKISTKSKTKSKRKRRKENERFQKSSTGSSN